MAFGPAQINIQHLKINNSDHSSTISIGSVTAQNKNVTAKKNQGIGQQLADSTLRVSTISMVVDHDLLDALAADSKSK